MSRKRRTLLGSLVAAVVAVAGSLVAVPATPASAATSYWFITNWYGEQVQQSITSTQVEMFRNRGDQPLPNRAKWQIVALNGDDKGYYEIWTYYGECMAVLNASKASGATIISAKCGSAQNDQWGLVKVKTSNGHDYYNLVNRRSKLCLNIKGASVEDNAPLIQYKCDSSAWNEWFTWTGAAAWPHI